MRKMTKTAVTLAAMFAMTVACASLAFAAEKQEPNISSIAREEEAVNTSAVGEWSGDDVKGWSFTKEGNIKLKDQWAQIDGVWYYFLGDKIAQNRFLTLDDKGYFFDETGRLATGWQKITSKMDAYSDIIIADELYNPDANGYTQVDPNHEYDYHDFVWCYFDESGIAKENEWFQSPESGLWYFFDGNVMVKGIYDYWVNPDNYDAADSDEERLYGFDSDGAMLVGWNSRNVDTTWNNPTADEKGKIWYYYKSNGQMQKAGWMRLDGKWYLFANQNADDTKWHKGGYPLIVNSYVKSAKTNGKDEYFYVNDKGELVSGVQTIKNVYKVEFYTDDKKVDVAWQKEKTANKNITINFADKGYAAKQGIEGNRYFTLSEDTDIIAATVGKSVNNDVHLVNGTNYIYDVTDVTDPTKVSFSFTDGAYNVQGTNWKFTDRGTDDVDNMGENVTTYTFELLQKSANLRAVKENQVILKLDNKVKEATEAADKCKEEYEIKTKDYKSAETEWQSAQKSADGSSYTASISVTGYENVTSWTATGERYTGNVKPSEAVSGAAARVMRSADTQDIVSLEKELAALIDTTTDETEKAVLEEALANVQAARKDIEQKIADDNGLTEQHEAYKAALKALEDAKTALLAAEEKIWDLRGEYEITENPDDFMVRGELVRNAFIGRTDNLYLADNDGNFVTNKAVLFNTLDDDKKYDDTYQNLYILFGSNGKAVDGYEGTKKTIVIGGISYWSTNYTVKLGDATATVFVSNRVVDGVR